MNISADICRGKSLGCLFVFVFTSPETVSNSYSMPASHAQVAKRAFVAVILALGRSLDLALDVSRESDDAAVLSASTRLARRRGKHS